MEGGCCGGVGLVAVVGVSSYGGEGVVVVVGLDSCGRGGAVVEVCMLVVERGVVCMVGAVVGWWAVVVERMVVDRCGKGQKF